jgi:hypothetical protein
MSPNEERRLRDQGRRATKKAAEERWRARVDSHLGFLREQYGFRVTRPYRTGLASPCLRAFQRGRNRPSVLTDNHPMNAARR